MDRLCPKCGQRYHAEVGRCPVHRVALVDDPFIGRSLGPFVITGYLGSGAMGVVYRAHPPAAIKVLNVVRARLQPELVRRFELEASAIARLENPHTVRLYDAGTTGEGHLYITMELLSGQTLDEVLRTRHTLAPNDAADIIHQAAAALGEAHEKWVVHRDIKPDNLFLEAAEGGRPFVRVLDFGVVRINTESVARSITGTVAGTPAYMSPEQLKSEKTIDGRTDIYSLGVVLYQALAGRNPFQGDGLMQTIQRHLYQPVPPLPAGVPAPLAELTLSMLHKAREDRPASMAEVQRRLAAIGFVRPAPVRLAESDPSGPVVALGDTPLAGGRGDAAFRRARQVTPVARPMDPEPADGAEDDGGDDAADEAALDAAAARDAAALDAAALEAAFGGALGETAPSDPALAALAAEAARAGATGPDTVDETPHRRADPWRTSAPPAARPPIDADPTGPWRPSAPPRAAPVVDDDPTGAWRPSKPPVGVPALDDDPTGPWRPSRPPAARPSARTSIDAHPDAVVRTDPRPSVPDLGGTWIADLDPPPPPRRPRRLWAVFIALIFGLGAGAGVWLVARGPSAVEVPLTRLMSDARTAIEHERWDDAIGVLDRVLDARPGDPIAAGLRAEAMGEAEARETWHEILDRIGDEQWQGALHRIEAFPEGSVYTARVRALAGLVDEGLAEASLEEALTTATRGEWAGAASIADTLAARPRPPERLPILRAAIERRRFAPTAYTTHLLEARERMANGDWRLAITRLQQAAEDIDAPDARIERRLFACSRALGDAPGALGHALAWRRLERDPRLAPVLAHAIERLQARVGR